MQRRRGCTALAEEEKREMRTSDFVNVNEWGKRSLKQRENAETWKKQVTYVGFLTHSNELLDDWVGLSVGFFSLHFRSLLG